jgi:hypothetical protein
MIHAAVKMPINFSTAALGCCCAADAVGRADSRNTTANTGPVCAQNDRDDANKREKEHRHRESEREREREREFF